MTEREDEYISPMVADLEFGCLLILLLFVRLLLTMAIEDVCWVVLLIMLAFLDNVVFSDYNNARDGMLHEQRCT